MNGESLSQKAVKGSVWLIATMIVQAVSNLIGLMVLTRLLLPSDFGVVSAMQVVLGIVSIFSNLGIAVALIQRKEITETHIAVGFTASLIFGFLFYAFFWFFALFLPALFNANIDVWLFRVYALIFPILSWSTVSSVLLTRKLDFKRLFIADALSLILGTSLIAIVLAYFGLGPWSIIYGALSNAVIKSICLSVMSPHTRRICLFKKEFRDLYWFGGMYTFLRLTNYFASMADNYIVGRWLGVEALGFYDRAFQIMVIPGSYMGNIIDNVTFPALAKIQDEKQTLKYAYLQGINLSDFIMMPLSVFLIIISPELIDVLMGSKWLGLVLPLQVLLVGIAFRNAIRMCDSLARAKGALRQNTYQKLIFFAAIVLGSLWGRKAGLVGVAVGVDIAIFLHYLLMAKLGADLTNGTLIEFLKAQKSGIVNALILLTVTLPSAYVVRLFIHNSLLVLSAISIVVFGAIFLIVILFPSLLDQSIRHWIKIFLGVFISMIPSKNRMAVSLEEEINFSVQSKNKKSSKR
jgi:PST family polysaccharide transporter